MEVNWTKHNKPNGEIPYDHVLLNTPLGKVFIEWKSWKENPSYDVYLEDEWVAYEYKLDVAKQIALNHLTIKLQELKDFLKVKEEVERQLKEIKNKQVTTVKPCCVEFETVELDPEIAKSLNDFCKQHGSKEPTKKRF